MKLSPSREADVVSLITSFAGTGTATGRFRNGSRVIKIIFGCGLVRQRRSGCGPDADGAANRRPRPGYADVAVALDFYDAGFDSVSCVRYQDSVMRQSERGSYAG
jgi:hypothetical protein